MKNMTGLAKANRNIQLISAIIVVGIVTAVDYLMVSSSHAQSPYIGANASDGTLSGGATKQTDSTAVNGSSVLFGGTTESNFPCAAGPITDNADGTVTYTPCGGGSPVTVTAPTCDEGAGSGCSSSTGTSTGSGSSGSTGPYTLTSSMAPVTNYTNLVANYQFNGSSLPSGWTAASGFNDGLQSTTYEASQVTVSGGAANLTAVPTSSGASSYYSGYISSSTTYNHGRFDFVAKMPAGQGLWSGLWLDSENGSSTFGEIDVQEMLLGDTHTVYGSAHDWVPPNASSQIWGETQHTSMSGDASQGFHDYSVVYQPGMITWAVDGVAYAQYTEAQGVAQGGWPFGDSSTSGAYLQLIADLAVASPSEWGGAPNSATVFPATMQVQSVQVWQ